MNDVKNNLSDIEKKMNAIGERIRHEGRVYSEELSERQRLGLTGDDAIKHYNDWMEREGMPELKVT